MKHIVVDRINIVESPLNAMDVIRKLSTCGHVCDESVYIFNISDIVNKHKIWKKTLPRVIPFYGESVVYSSFTNYFVYNMLELRPNISRLYKCYWFRGN